MSLIFNNDEVKSINDLYIKINDLMSEDDKYKNFLLNAIAHLHGNFGFCGNSMSKEEYMYYEIQNDLTKLYEICKNNLHLKKYSNEVEKLHLDIFNWPIKKINLFNKFTKYTAIFFEKFRNGIYKSM